MSAEPSALGQTTIVSVTMLTESDRAFFIMNHLAELRFIYQQTPTYIASYPILWYLIHNILYNIDMIFDNISNIADRIRPILLILIL